MNGMIMRYLFVFVACMAVFYTMPNAHAQTSCNLLNQASAIPTGFSSPYDFVLNTLSIDASCGNDKATITVGTGSENTYVYEIGYYWNGASWTQYSYTPKGTRSGVWLVEEGEYEHTSLQPQGETNYVLGYICTWNGSNWKCGCRDVACVTPGWQLQTFNTPQSSSSGSSGGAQNCSAPKGIKHQFNGEVGVDNWNAELNFTTPEQPHTRETITSPANLVPYGTASMKTEIKPGDPQWSVDVPTGQAKRRAEYSWTQWRFDGNKEGWAGGAFYLPSNPMRTAKGIDIFQLHLYPDPGEMMHFTVWDGELRATNDHYGGKFMDLDLAPYLDRWNTMVVHFKPSSGSDGFIKIWINDELVADEKGRNRDGGSRGPYFKHGAYFWGYERWDKTKRAVVYHDNLRVADETSNYESVDPKCWE